MSPHVHWMDRRTLTEFRTKRRKWSAHIPHTGECYMPVFLVSRLSPCLASVETPQGSSVRSHLEVDSVLMHLDQTNCLMTVD